MRYEAVCGCKRLGFRLSLSVRKISQEGRGEAGSSSYYEVCDPKAQLFKQRSRALVGPDEIAPTELIRVLFVLFRSRHFVILQERNHKDIHYSYIQVDIDVSSNSQWQRFSGVVYHQSRTVELNSSITVIVIIIGRQASVAVR